MKKNQKIIIDFVLACLIIAAMALFQPKTLACGDGGLTDEDGNVTNCMDIETTEASTDEEIEETEEFEETEETAAPYFIAEPDIKSKEDALHSLFLAGNSVSSEDYVDGVGLLAGNLIEANGIYDYGLFAGNSIKISGEIKNDLFVAGNAVIITEDAMINRDLYAASNTLNISTNLYGNVFAGGNRLVLDNVTIDGDLNADFDQIVIKGKSSVAGNFKYGDSTLITGLDNLSYGSIETFISHSDKTVSFSTKLINKLISIVGKLVLAFVLILIFGNTLKKILEKFEEKEIFKDTLIGLGIIILVPIVSILVLITVIGMPVAFVTLFAWVIALIMSTPASGVVLGEIINKHIIKKDKLNLYAKASIGIVTIELLSLIPVIGIMVSMMSLLFGLGFIFSSFKQKQ